MASGRRRLVINTRERAISTDINRLQSFIGKDDSELWRYALDAVGNDDLDAGAVITEPNTVETPLRAEIVNGLLVRPQPATLNLLVDTGVAMVMNPDAAPDESNYKQIVDAGVTIAGSLVMTANASGSIRIDVVEFRINPTEIVVTDNRDIFAPSTGLFTVASVNKELAGRLEYRVRLGVPAGGVPANASGWTPICVASVPNGAVNVDTVTFWDVRPLLSDRAYQPFGLRIDRPELRGSMINAIAPSNVLGIVEAVGPAVPTVNGVSRRLGGRLRSGGVVADGDFIDATIAANRDPAFALVAKRPWYLYLLTPHNLPRWARYTAAGTRLPRSPRGIPVVSMVAPDNDGKPSAAIAMPTSTGLGVSTSAGVVVGAGYVLAASIQGGFYGDRENGFLMFNVDDVDGVPIDPMVVVATASFAAGPPSEARSRFDLVAGTHYPTHARAIYCEFRANITLNNALGVDVVADLQHKLRVFIPDFPAFLLSNIKLFGQALTLTTTGAVADTVNVYWAGWVTLPPVYPTTPAPTQRIDYVIANEGTASQLTAITSGHLRVWGWKF